MLLEQMIQRWQGFRRALRMRDQEAFDRMMDRARVHASAAGYSAQPDPVESVFISILLEHEKDLGELRARVEKDQSRRENTIVAKEGDGTPDGCSLAEPNDAVENSGSSQAP